MAGDEEFHLAAIFFLETSQPKGQEYEIMCRFFVSATLTLEFKFITYGAKIPPPFLQRVLDFPGVICLLISSGPSGSKSDSEVDSSARGMISVCEQLNSG